MNDGYFLVETEEGYTCSFPFATQEPDENKNSGYEYFYYSCQPQTFDEDGSITTSYCPTKEKHFTKFFPCLSENSFQIHSSFLCALRYNMIIHNPS